MDFFHTQKPVRELFPVRAFCFGQFESAALGMPEFGETEVRIDSARTEHVGLLLNLCEGGRCHLSRNGFGQARIT